MKCIYSAEDIITHSEGGFFSDNKQELLKHIESCQKCNKIYTLLSETDEFLQEEEPLITPIFQSIVGKIDTNRYSKSYRLTLETILSRLSPVLKPVAAFAVVISLSIYIINFSGLFPASSDLEPNTALSRDQELAYTSMSKQAVPVEFTKLPLMDLIKESPNTSDRLISNRTINTDTSKTFQLEIYTEQASTANIVKAYIRDGNKYMFIGQVGEKGAENVIVEEKKLPHGVSIWFREFSDNTPIYNMNVQYDSTQSSWTYSTGYSRYYALDLDFDGKIEYTSTIPGENVFIYKETEAGIEMLDLKKATGSKKAFLRRGTIHWFETVGQNDKSASFVYNNNLLSRITGPLQNWYIIYDSNKRAITEADYSNLTIKELEIARNEIYARHGYEFQTSSFREYFMSCPWYKINPDYTDTLLTPTELNNAVIIKKYVENLQKNLVKNNISDIPSFTTDIDKKDKLQENVSIEKGFGLSKSALFNRIDLSGTTLTGSIPFIPDSLLIFGNTQIKAARSGNLLPSSRIWETYHLIKNRFEIAAAGEYLINQKALVLTSVALSESVDTFKQGMTLNAFDVVTLSKTNDKDYIEVVDANDKNGYFLIGSDKTVIGTNFTIDKILTAYTYID